MAAKRYCDPTGDSRGSATRKTRVFKSKTSVPACASVPMTAPDRNSRKQAVLANLRRGLTGAQARDRGRRAAADPQQLAAG